MATRKNTPIIGDYGTVDGLVLSKWNDINVMRARPGKRRKKTKSVKLIQQNTVFGIVSRFFKSATKLINLGYQKPKVVKMTKFNAAISYHLENAIIADPDDPSLSLSKIKLTRSIRKTQSAWNAELSAAAENKVSVTWELNPFPQKSTQLDDKVKLVFYDTVYKMFISINDVGVIRSDLSYTRVFHKRFTGHEIYWYMFLVSADGKLVSETEYLGMVTVTA